LTVNELIMTKLVWMFVNFKEIISALSTVKVKI